MIRIMNTLEIRERKPVSLSLPLLARVDARAKEADCGHGELIRAAIDADAMKLEAQTSRRLRLRKADDARRAPEEDGP